VLMVGQILSVIISAITVIFVARVIGSESYGEYTVVLVPVAIAMLVQDVGMSNSLTRFCAMYRSEGRNEDLKSVVLVGLLFNVLSSLLVSGVLYLSAGFVASSFLLRPELEPLVRAVSFAVLGSSVMVAIQGIMVGYEFMTVRSGVQILWSISRAVISVALVLIGWGSSGAVWGYSCAFLVAAGAGLLLLWVLVKPGTSIKDPIKTLRLLLGFGIPFYLATLISGGLNQVYNSLMAVNVPTDIIGNYGAAMNFGGLVSFLTLPIGTVLFPMFAKLRRDDPNLKMLFQSAVKYTSLLTTPVVACIVLLAEPLTGLIYGADYPYASLFLSLYVLIFAFEGLGGVSMSNLINGIGESGVIFRSSVITFIVGAPLALILIPRYQIIGLLVTMIVAPRFGWLYMVMWMRRALGFVVNWVGAARSYASSFLAFGVSYVLIHSLGLGGVAALVVGGVSFLATYFVVLPLSGALGDVDFQVLNGMTEGLDPMAPFIKKMLSLMRMLSRRRKDSSVN